MAFSKILLVSCNPEEFKQLHTVLGEDYLFEVAADLNQCCQHQKQHNSKSLTIIDADLLAEDFQVSTLIKDVVGKIVIIGHHWPEDKQIEAIASGVSGYCDRKISADLLCRVVASVLNGEVWVPRHLIPKVIALLIDKNIIPFSMQESQEVIFKKQQKLKCLSDRELQVAKMISKGCVNKQIASALFITERTVKAHLTKIFKKLEVPDRIHLAIYMKGLVED